MPANLTPQYYAAEESFRKAITITEKISALEDMLAVIPKHKGTEKLQADIKRRLAKLREEGQKKNALNRHDPFHIEKQGAGQVALVGYPNSGKSALVGALTRAKVKVADYPFTTVIPSSGMLPFEEVHIQLVDTPPLTTEGFPPGLAGLLISADALLLVIDSCAGECLDQLESILRLLDERKIIRIQAAAALKVKPIQRLIIVANKTDRLEGKENLQLMQELLPPNLDILPVSAEKGKNLEQLKTRLFAALEIIRVFTKPPGKEPDFTRPFILPQGSSVLELVEDIHKDFVKNLRGARIWGSARFPGQSVPKEYIIRDKDIIELLV
ncbi:MAG TPA: GTP-binding protein HSR1 [Desulfotomaculum sp.]|nr:MAG: TGS domain-containing protein [Desulfotomaculum sp. 46_80]HAG10292.1 GTP-binding protein HSR1 [Desulfotomaculum sp.]HBY03011.1 GTP-binding protein HSR1 [Desulfotomaculum sp.]